MSSSVFQALDHGILSLISSLVRQLIVLLPAAFLLSRLFELEQVWLAFPIAELFSCAAGPSATLDKGYSIVPSHYNTAFPAVNGHFRKNPKKPPTDPFPPPPLSGGGFFSLFPKRKENKPWQKDYLPLNR